MSRKDLVLTVLPVELQSGVSLSCEVAQLVQVALLSPQITRGMHLKQIKGREVPGCIYTTFRPSWWHIASYGKILYVLILT